MSHWPESEWPSSKLVQYVSYFFLSIDVCLEENAKAGHAQHSRGGDGTTSDDLDGLMDVVSARPKANIRRRTNPEQTICASGATNRPILDGGRQAKPKCGGDIHLH